MATAPSAPTQQEIPTIYVGRKPILRYVMACLRLFLSGGANKIRICARGRSISRAVDVVEVLKTRYLPGLIEVESIKTGTEELPSTRQPGRTSRVSTIEIIVKKK